MLGGNGGVLAPGADIGGLIASKARCGGPYGRWRLAFLGFVRRRVPPSGGGEGEYSLYVPGHGHKAPLAAHVFEPPQRKLAESEHRFDDAEHRFRRLFAQGVESPALRRLQPIRHGFDRRRIFRRRRHRLEALLQRQMMRLTPIAISGATPAFWQASPFPELK